MTKNIYTHYSQRQDYTAYLSLSPEGKSTVSASSHVAQTCRSTQAVAVVIQTDFVAASPTYRLIHMLLTIPFYNTHNSGSCFYIRNFQYNFHINACSTNCSNVTPHFAFGWLASFGAPLYAGVLEWNDVTGSTQPEPCRAILNRTAVGYYNSCVSIIITIGCYSHWA
jgi:hypothetical protein